MPSSTLSTYSSSSSTTSSSFATVAGPNNTSTPSEQQQLKSLYEKATSLHKSQQFSQALQQYFQIVTKYPKHHKSHFKIASLYEKGVCRADEVPLLPLEPSLRQEALQSRAVHHYEKAAELGYDVAQFNLGVMLMRGSGTDKNEDMAVKWLRRASNNGSKRASIVLEKIIAEQQMRSHRDVRQLDADRGEDEDASRHRNQEESDEQLFERLNAIRRTNPSLNQTENGNVAVPGETLSESGEPSGSNNVESRGQHQETETGKQPSRILSREDISDSINDHHETQQPTDDATQADKSQFSLLNQSMSSFPPPEIPRMPPPDIPLPDSEPDNNDADDDNQESHSDEDSLVAQRNALKQRQLQDSHNLSMQSVHSFSSKRDAEENDTDDDEETQHTDDLQSLDPEELVSNLLESSSPRHHHGSTSPESNEYPSPPDHHNISPTPRSVNSKKSTPNRSEQPSTHSPTNESLGSEGSSFHDDDDDVDDDPHVEYELQDATLPDLPSANKSLLTDTPQTAPSPSEPSPPQQLPRKYPLKRRNTPTSPLTISTSRNSSPKKDRKSPSSPRTPTSAHSSVRRRGFGPEELAEIQELEDRLNDAKKELKERRTAMKLLGAQKKRQEQLFKKKEAKFVKTDNKIKQMELKLMQKEQDYDQLVQDTKLEKKQLRERFESQLTEKEELIATLVSENDVVQDAVEDHLTSLKNNHKHQLEEKDAAIADLQSNLQKRDKQIQSLQMERKQMEEEFSQQLENMRSKYEEELSTLTMDHQSELDDLNQQLDDSKTFHQQELEMMQQDLKKNNAAHATQAKEYKSRIDDLREEIRSMKQKHHNDLLQKDSSLRADFQQQKQQLMQRIQQAEQNVDQQVQEKIRNIEEQYQQDFKQQYSEHKEQIATLQHEHKEQLEELKKQLRDLHDENQDLRNNDAMSKRLAEYEKTISELRANEKEAQRIIANVSRQNVSFIETIELNAENEVKFVEKIDLQDKKIRLLESRCRQLEAHVEHLKAETRKMPSHDEVQRVKAQSEKLQQIMIQQFDKIQEYKDTILDLEEDLKESSGQMKQLEDQLSEAKQRNASLSAANSNKTTTASEFPGFNFDNSADNSNGDEGGIDAFMSEDQGRSELFEQNYMEMLRTLQQKQRNGSANNNSITWQQDTSWGEILQKLQVLKQEYQNNLVSHKRQIHDVIQYCMSMKEF